MQNLKILNSKEKKEIINILEKQFGFKEKLGYVFLKNNKDKIFCINRDFSLIDLSKLRINSVGLYFARKINDKLRLSIEGSQIVGKKASKNIIELNEKEAVEWFRGNDINKGISSNEFVILKHENDFLGCGKSAEGKILNYVPKARRIYIN